MLLSSALVTPENHLKEDEGSQRESGHWTHDFLLWYFDIWGLPGPGETAVPRAPVPRENKGLTSKCGFYMRTNQSKVHTPLPVFFTLLIHSRPLFDCPKHCRARHQTTRDSPCALESPPKLSKLTNPKPTYPHPFFPMETAIMALAHIFLLLPSVVSPCGPVSFGVPLLLGTVGLLASLYLDNNKTYTLKQDGKSWVKSLETNIKAFLRSDKLSWKQVRVQGQVIRLESKLYERRAIGTDNEVKCTRTTS